RMLVRTSISALVVATRGAAFFEGLGGVLTRIIDSRFSQNYDTEKCTSFKGKLISKLLYCQNAGLTEINERVFLQELGD
ncbi:MAG TPA: hypothetical protein VK440_03175, partial [Burkholderiales bacterium]|nr:hypothetical protein [Burkholderiales bacterium]